jgi:hypothetical protein
MDDKNNQEDPRFSQMMSMGARGGAGGGGGRIAKGSMDSQPQHGAGSGGHQESQLQMPEMYSQPQPSQHGKILK